MSDERDVSRRYRELGREEPPRALDDAILAAARRAAETRPAPLVVPSGRRRWYFPLAAAAVIVLAVAVTMHVEREQPSEEIASAPAPLRDQVEPQQAKPATPEPARKAEPLYQYTPDPKPRAAAKPAPAAPQSATDTYARRMETPSESPPAELQKRQAPAAQDEARMQAEVRAQAEARAQADRAAAAESQQRARVNAVQGTREDSGSVASRIAGSIALQSPEQALQGIADLRRQGRHDEADKALAEFRRRYPDYRLSEEMRSKVERK